MSDTITDDFTPNAMSWEEYQKKILDHLPLFKKWWDSIPNAVIGKTNFTFTDWNDEFSSWMANGAPELYTNKPE